MTTTSIDQPVAVVTGAARGIGYAIAEWFLARRYRVALMDYEAETLQQAAEKLSSQGAVMPLHCDVSDADSVAAAVGKIDAKWGRVDALVNNAGIAIFKPLLETSFDEWRSVLATNLDGVFLCSQACAAIMKRQGSGSIVNIA